jgi:hypothetical protein
MKQFLLSSINSANIFDILGFIINTIIALIAIIAILTSYKQFNKNIQITKIEEIFSLCELLGQHYPNLFEIYNLLADYNENGIDITLRNEIFKNYITIRTNYLKDFDIKDLIKSCYRLEVLSKTYLFDNTQLHVLSFIRMMRHLIDISISQQ